MTWKLNGYKQGTAQEAEKLVACRASIPADMDEVKKGLLAKDVLEKLKRVEKLSKRVREELTRASTARLVVATSRITLKMAGRSFER